MENCGPENSKEMGGFFVLTVKLMLRGISLKLFIKHLSLEIPKSYMHDIKCRQKQKLSLEECIEVGTISFSLRQVSFQVFHSLFKKISALLWMVVTYKWTYLIKTVFENVFTGI